MEKDDNISKVDKSRNKAGRKKGGEKTGGRKKGTPNKRTADITERLKDEDIVGSLLEIAHTTQDESTKVTVYKELMKYVYPQRKAVEVTGEVPMPEIKIKGI
jgi:hypothetical protein